MAIFKMAAVAILESYYLYKTAKINCKKRHRFKKATLYERKVTKKQTFFIRWQKLLYSYNRLLGNHSLIATYYVNQLLSSFYTCNKISMTLEVWNTRMHHCFNFVRKFKLRLPNHLMSTPCIVNPSESEFGLHHVVTIECFLQFILRLEKDRVELIPCNRSVQPRIATLFRSVAEHGLEFHLTLNYVRRPSVG
jgi:hypothetical protein